MRENAQQISTSDALNEKRSARPGPGEASDSMRLEIGISAFISFSDVLNRES
jgi:hypothetical protein